MTIAVDLGLKATKQTIKSFKMLMVHAPKKVV